jgi:hypothetical protein
LPFFQVPSTGTHPDALDGLDDDVLVRHLVLVQVEDATQHEEACGVARRYIFIPKIPMLLYFGRP